MPDGDTAAVMYMKDRLTCNYLMAVNLKDGRQKWDLKLPGDRTGDGDYIDPRIRLAGGKAKVVGRIGSATLAAADGKLLEHDKSNLLYECRETDAPTDGKILISVVSCPGEKRDFLRKIDFATTKEDWTWKVPEGLKVLAVVEIAPVVVAVGKSEGEGPTDLLSVNSQGRTQATISLAGKAGGRVAVRNNTAYLATQPKEVSGSIKENEIEAIDLKSGLRRWTSSAGGHRVSRPIDFDDDKLLVYQAAQAGDGGRLVDLDLRDGSPTVRKRLPAESSAVESDLDFRSEIYFEDDRVFIVADITAPAKYMLMSFS
ncbi:hypothetical protein VR41_13490 [Streptomyces sp. NRRL B-1568]|nr:hypothetical protein VR41_13490 [Streptomyces sp. NRRL B-1568]